MNITRRDLLKKTAAAAAGGAVFANFPAEAAENAADSKSRVVLVRSGKLFEGDKIDEGTASDMLDTALSALTGKERDLAWLEIVKPSDIVGIKTNEWWQMPTPAILNSLLKSRVINAGVKEENVSVRDRGVLEDSVFKRATALINIRPLRTHAWAGVGSCIKNYIMFSPKPSSYHDDSCASLAALHSLPAVKGKTRLHILVMFNPLFHHRFSQDVSDAYRWKYAGLIAGYDPVAVDSTGLRILQAKRNDYFGEAKPFNPPAKHIELADTRYRLGTADSARIELIKVGWNKDSYI